MAPSSHELPPFDLVRVLRQPAELVTRLELAFALDRPSPLAVARRRQGAAPARESREGVPTASEPKRETRERG